MSKSIFLIDDHSMIREGITAWIEKNTELKITGSFNSIAPTLEELSNCKINNTLPHIAIIDIDLGNESGFDLLKKITSEYPEIKVIMYSMHQEQGYSLQAKNFGAKAYISKASESNEFKKCIEAVINNQEYLEESLQKKNEILANYMLYLTKKERIVLQELLKSKSNEEIADALHVTLHTAEVYVSKIYDKLGISSRTELMKKFG